MRRGTNLPAVAGFNQNVILDLIRRRPEGISRVEIAEVTRLAPQTISNVTRRLLDDGLIVEAGKHIQGRGKPRVILQLDPQSRFAVGVHLDPTVITYVVLDLGGRVLAHQHTRTPKAARPKEIVARIAKAIPSMVRTAGVDPARVLGVGIAAPGPIDASLGAVVDPPLLDGWMNVPLRDALATATGFPCLLEKDVTAAAVGELWTAGDDARTDFAFFYYGTGIGVGLALNGEVFRGVTGNAGEGGTLVVRSGDLPRSRRSEMLGHLATPQFVVAQAVQAGILDTQPPEDDLAAIDDAFSAVVLLAADGHDKACAILDRAGDLIASALVSIINLLDIDEIVLGGPAWARVAGRLRPRIAAVLAKSPDRVTRHDIALRESSIGEDVAAVGAACLVLDGELSPRPSALLIAG